MPKTLYIFSIFNIRMATENSQIMFFLMHADMTTVIMLTKLFWVKLNTTKHYWSRLTDRDQMTFSANPIEPEV